MPAWHGTHRLSPATTSAGCAPISGCAAAWPTCRRSPCSPASRIEENIRIGGQFLPRRALRARVDELYALFSDLRERRHGGGGSLSGGQRKMLGIAKALAGEPRLLVMDEPSAGLSPLFVKEVIAVLAPFRDAGQSRC